jgi:hypothetical protein
MASHAHLTACAPVVKLRRDGGEWPSGKAMDFGSIIRRFEPFLPSKKPRLCRKVGALGLQVCFCLGGHRFCRRRRDFFGPRSQFQLQFVKEAARLELARAVFHVHDARADFQACGL